MLHTYSNVWFYCYGNENHPLFGKGGIIVQCWWNRAHVEVVDKVNGNYCVKDVPIGMLIKQ